MMVITAGAAGLATVRRKRQTALLESLARQWELRFAAEDRFHLAGHVAAHLSVPGAADVVIRDVMYRQEASSYRYLFTVEYTMGVLRTKHRMVSAGVCTEMQHCPISQAYSQVALGAEGTTLAAQYDALRKAFFNDQAIDPARELKPTPHPHPLPRGD